MKIFGIVEKHLGRGRGLGFPTANIKLNEEQIPDGIYVGHTFVDGKKLPSLIFIGAAVTYEEDERQVEIYILDFEEDLYGKEIEAHLYERLRGNRKFQLEEELVAQMQHDEQMARDFFANFSD